MGARRQRTVAAALPGTSLLRPRRGRHARASLLRPVARTVIGALVPGLLAWRSGARRTAAGVAGSVTALLVAGLAIVVAAGGPVHALVDVEASAALAAVNLAVATVRLVEVVVVVARWRRSTVRPRPTSLGRRRYTGRIHRRAVWTRVLAGTAAVSLVVVPHLTAGAQVTLVRSTLDEVFVDVPLEVAGVQLTAPPDSGTASASDAATPRERVVADDREGPTDAPLTAMAGADGLVTILLIGLDAGAGREGARNDTNLVVTVDPGTADTALVGVPRNAVGLPLPTSDDECRCFRQPLFALYGWGQAHPERYPGADDPGAEAVRGSLSELIGRPIDHHVTADLGAFVDLVDALGGVTVHVDRALADDKSDPWDAEARVPIDLAPGRHRLDGGQALTYVRSRHDSDYDRMARQRCVASALQPSAGALSVPRALGLVASVRGRLTSDIPRRDVPALLDLVRRVERDEVASLGLVPPDFVSGRVDGYPVLDEQAVRNAVAALPSASVAQDCGT